MALLDSSLLDVPLQESRNIPARLNDCFSKAKPSVIELASCNFSHFLRDKDVVMVMFYEPRKAECCFSRKHMDVAATTTVRPNHAYAVVNCSTNPELCEQEGAYSLPFFRVYSKGYTMETIKDSLNFNAKEMRKYVLGITARP